MHSVNDSSFPIAALPNDHKLHGLTQIYYLTVLEVRSFTGLKIKVQEGCIPSGGYRGETVLCSSQLLEAAYVPLLVAPSPTFKANSVTSPHLLTSASMVRLAPLPTFLMLLSSHGLSCHLLACFPLKDTYDNTGQLDNPGFSPHFKILITSAKFLFGVGGGRTMWLAGSQFPNQGLNPCSLQWKHRVLTTGPPRNSLQSFFAM